VDDDAVRIAERRIRVLRGPGQIEHDAGGIRPRPQADVLDSDVGCGDSLRGLNGSAERDQHRTDAEPDASLQPQDSHGPVIYSPPQININTNYGDRSRISRFTGH